MSRGIEGMREDTIAQPGLPREAPLDWPQHLVQRDGMHRAAETVSPPIKIKRPGGPWTGTGQISRGAAQAPLPITAQPRAAFPDTEARKFKLKTTQSASTAMNFDY